MRSCLTAICCFQHNIYHSCYIHRFCQFCHCSALLSHAAICRDVCGASAASVPPAYQMCRRKVSAEFLQNPKPSCASSLCAFPAPAGHYHPASLQRGRKSRQMFFCVSRPSCARPAPAGHSHPASLQRGRCAGTHAVEQPLADCQSVWRRPVLSRVPPSAAVRWAARAHAALIQRKGHFQQVAWCSCTCCTGLA